MLDTDQLPTNVPLAQACAFTKTTVSTCNFIQCTRTKINIETKQEELAVIFLGRRVRMADKPRRICAFSRVNNERVLENIEQMEIARRCEIPRRLEARPSVLRRFAVGYPVEHSAPRPSIRFRCVQHRLIACGVGDLGCGVQPCAVTADPATDECSAGRAETRRRICSPVLLRLLGNTEIDQLDSVAGKEHEILRFDVKMHLSARERESSE